jgi:hypothetical protein
MKINRKKLLRLYMKAVSDFCNENEWISTVTPELVIGLVSDVLEQNPKIIEEEKE